MSNILFTYITPFHPLKGGIGRVTDTLAREFQMRGHRVFYLIYDSAITIKHEYDYPAPLFYLPSKELLSEENVEFYSRFIKEHAIDYVINQSGNFSDSELWVKARSEHTKVISVLHSEPWVAYKHFWHEIVPLRNQTFVERCKQIARIFLFPKLKREYRERRKQHFEMLLPLTDKVCTLTNRYYKSVTEICPGYEDKYCAINNPNSYGADQVKDYSFLQGRKKNQIIFVGLLQFYKRADRAIITWRKLEKQYPEWEFVIVGGGGPEYTSFLRNLAAGCEHVTFVGNCDPKPYYETGKIIMLPSNFEGWPMVLTEAMQHGVVPVVFDSTDAFYDILDDGKCGMLVESFNMYLYKKQVQRLMDNPSMWSDMSKRAYEHVKQYDKDNIVEQWERLLSK